MSFLSPKYTVIVGSNISLHRRGGGVPFLQEAMASVENADPQTFGNFIERVTGNGRSRLTIANIALTYPHVHHILLPWNPEILSPSDRNAYAQSALEKQYQVCAKDWYCDIAWQRFGSAAIVCAIQRPIVDSLVASCQRLQVKTPRIGSLLIDAIPAPPRRREESGLLVVRQTGFCEFAFRRAGEWRALLAMPDSGRTIEQQVLTACVSSCVSAYDFPDVVQICDLTGPGGMPDTYRLRQVAETSPEYVNVHV